MDEQLQQRTKQILQQMASSLPSTLISVEKQQHIGRELLPRASEEERLTLRRFVDEVLVNMRSREASDVDLGGWGTQGYIWLRVHGDKRPVKDYGRFSAVEFDILIQNLLMGSQLDMLYNNRNLDFSYNIERGESRYYHRADTYFDMDQLALNMRAISTDVRPYEGYNFHGNVTRTLSLAHTKEGLILLTGITGSGKSTTLDAIIDLNNRTVDSHIIIIASPVEFVHTPKRSIVRHREVGRDTRSFKDGTIEALRQDPDIIVIGEMRDPDTIMSGLEVADSGHKVFSTLHTSSAIESIDRIIGEVPPEEQTRVRNRLADVLRCVISQKLAPSTDGKRVLAKEILLMTPSTKAAIKNNNTGEIYQMINEGNKFGMMTMEQDLKRLLQARAISKETAMSYANNKRMMQQLMKAM
jgi:twitching motility protein PilT